MPFLRGLIDLLDWYVFLAEILYHGFYLHVTVFLFFLSLWVVTFVCVLLVLESFIFMSNQSVLGYLDNDF